MKTALATTFCAVGISALAVFATYNKTARPSAAAVAKSDMAGAKRNMPAKTNAKVISSQSLIEGATSVNTPSYALTLYGAFAFEPEESSADFMKTDSGHRFIVLDMAVENMSQKKALDIGQILLSATVTDYEGNIYPRNALALEAYEMQYPEQSHKTAYKAMKGKIKPGAYFRTTAYGFEAPEDVKEFLISFPERDKFSNDSKVQTLAFSVD